VSVLTKKSCQPWRQACRLQNNYQSQPARLPLRSISKYRLLAATNFQFVAIGIFKEKGVISRAVAFANFRPLELSSAGLANKLCNPIDFFPRIDPKRDACTIRFVVLVWTQAKEFRRLVAAGGKKV